MQLRWVFLLPDISRHFPTFPDISRHFPPFPTFPAGGIWREMSVQLLGYDTFVQICDKNWVNYNWVDYVNLV